MIAKVTRGTRVAGLAAYLMGPGRHNEHIDQHVIAASDEMDVPDPTLSAPGARGAFAGELNHYKDLYDVQVPRGEVYHFSLSNPAGDRVLSDAEWATTAREALSAVGLADDGPKAPVRWAAVRHGLSTAGNDHVHVVAVLARADGTKAAPHDDFAKLNRYCAAAEAELGLSSDRTPGRRSRAVPPASRADRLASERAGEDLPLRDRVQRDVRAAATAASTETEFVAGLRQAGLYVHPRYGAGGQEEVTGYKVAALRERDPEGHLVYFAGGRLARDLSLPALRAGWDDTPGERTRALAAWGQQPGSKGGTGGTSPAAAPTRPGPGRGPDLAAATAAARELHAAAQRLGASPVKGWDQWAGVARQTSGLLAVASSGWEGPGGGGLDRASRRLAQASAGVSRRGGAQGASSTVASGMGDLAGVLMAGSGKGGSAVLLMQLTRTAEAIAQAAEAAGTARSAHRETAALRQQFATAAATSGAAAGQAMTSTATAASGTTAPTGAGAGGTATMSESPETEAMEAMRPLAIAAAVSASQAARIAQRMGELSADRARAQADQERQLEEMRREARAAYRELARRDDWVGSASQENLNEAADLLGTGKDPRDRDALRRVEESGRDRFGLDWRQSPDERDQDRGQAGDQDEPGASVEDLQARAEASERAAQEVQERAEEERARAVQAREEGREDDARTHEGTAAGLSDQARARAAEATEALAEAERAREQGEKTGVKQGADTKTSAPDESGRQGSEKEPQTTQDKGGQTQPGHEAAAPSGDAGHDAPALAGAGSGGRRPGLRWAQGRGKVRGKTGAAGRPSLPGRENEAER